MGVDNWKQLEYRNILPNKVSTIRENGDHLKISVFQSASPLIYKFERPKKIKSITLKAVLTNGELNLNGIKQGEKNGDDFILRLGFVAKGNNQLNFFQKLTAPNWVKELYKLSDEKTGIDKIYFYNFASTDIKWVERIHPLSNLISEKIVGKIIDKKIELQFDLDSSKEYLGIWISSDGDDTKSKYELQLDQLIIDEI
jgi:hypothetical protein